MITKKEEVSLNEMLMEAAIPKLPEPFEPVDPSMPKEVWVKAVVKILRLDGSIDYVLAEHDFFSWNEVKIVKSMGGSGVAHSILGIYPYEFLNNSNLPNLSNKQDIINFLVGTTRIDDEESLKTHKKEILKKMFFNVCIKNQIRKKQITKSFSYYKGDPKGLVQLKEKEENGKE